MIAPRGRVGDFGLLPGIEAVGLKLAADEIATRNLNFFTGGIPRQRDDLHAVTQWARDGVRRLAVVMKTTRLRSNGTAR